MKQELSREKVLETIGVLALACLVLGHLSQNPGLKSWFLAAAVLLLYFMVRGQRIGRITGAAFLVAYVAYILFLFRA
jgi:Ca2+/Na+ antiporter